MKPLRHILFIVLLWLCIVPAMADDTAVLWQKLQHARECYNRGLADSAMIQARELLPGIANNGNKIMLAMDYVVIGTVYIDRDDKQAALKEYSKAAKIAEANDFLAQARQPKKQFLYHTMISVYGQLTMLSEDLGLYSQSREYARKGTQWIEQHGDAKQYAVAAAIFDEALNGNENGNENGNDHELNEYGNLKPETSSQRPAEVTAKDSVTVSHNNKERNADVRTIVRYVPLPDNRKSWAVMFIFIVVMVFLCYVVWQRRVRKRREREAAQQMDERYIEGREEERSRLARELHDGISNQLLAVEMKLNEDGTSPQTLQLLGESREMVRRVSHGLMPPEFEHVTICQALDSYAAQLNGLSQCEVCFAATPADADWSAIEPRTALEVYRIVQEAVSNALKHGNASLVSIGLHRSSANGFTVDVTDNNHELRENEDDNDHELREFNEYGNGNMTPTGIGHRTMSQRAALISGKIEVFRHSYGTTLRLSVGQ